MTAGYQGAHTCNAFSVVLHLISVHADLVTPDDSFEAVLFAELSSDIRAKLHANTSLARPPALFLLRVSPQHLHHQAGLPWLSLVVSVQFPDII